MHARFAMLYASTVVIGVLTACAPTRPKDTPKEGVTDFRVFIPPAAKRMDLPRNEMVVVGAPWLQPKPVYPPNLVASNIPHQAVCIAVAIDPQGKVHANRPLYGVPDCPADADAVEPAFVAATQNAVMHWRFLPTHLCTFEPGVDASAKGDDCGAEGARVESIPIMLAFVFTFTQIHGTSEVQTHRLTPAR